MTVSVIVAAPRGPVLLQPRDHQSTTLPNVCTGTMMHRQSTTDRSSIDPESEDGLQRIFFWSHTLETGRSLFLYQTAISAKRNIPLSLSLIHTHKMLESLTIFTKGGLILYQYVSQPSLVSGVNDAVSLTRNSVNGILASILLHPQRYPNKTYHITEGLTFLWRQEKDYCIMLMYPDILFEGPRQYLKQWATALLERTLAEYQLYYQTTTSTTANATVRPDPGPFDTIFRIVLNQSKTQKPAEAGTTTATTPQHTSTGKKENQNSNTSAPSSKAVTTGKEKRQWYDGNAKVTEKAMEALDKSKKETQGTAEDAHERALQEARLAYLPTAQDLAQDRQSTAATIPATTDAATNDSNGTWSSSFTSMFQQLTGSKILTDADLDAPLQFMKERLVAKNVATDIANTLCTSVRQSIRGKKLNSMYRVQTAVKQAMETCITKLLQNQSNKHATVDLLRAVYAKRGDGALFSTSSSTRRRPYVITVMGINGIGKTTTLAKLAYYFQSNGCQPLLVAGDTFRSGAVEQLRVHADCLQVPLFSQGYSKDPSAVAKAAIQHATEQGNDVVLIDTAGRMQNNVPLMKALGKLLTENRPDFVIMVCEALVGHDGLDQFHMFQQQACRSPPTSSLRAGGGGGTSIDGLILTKFDTVSDKVGAALTLTHETGVPIVFCGTGQKYHHLKKLDVSSIIDSLLS